MKQEKAFCRVVTGSHVDDGDATKERYEALIADQSFFFIVDLVSGTVWRTVEGRLVRWRRVPPKQLKAIVKLIESGQSLTARALGVADSTVEAARRLIEKPPKDRGPWQTIKTIRGVGEEPKRFRFDPDKGLPWCLIKLPLSVPLDHAEPNDSFPTDDVCLSAAGAVYFHNDGLIIVHRTQVTNQVRRATVLAMELVVPVRGGTRVLSPEEPSGRFAVGEEWLWPPHFRLGPSDGVSGALEFPAWTYGLEADDIAPGRAILAATLGDGSRIETPIELRLVAA